MIVLFLQPECCGKFLELDTTECDCVPCRISLPDMHTEDPARP